MLVASWALLRISRANIPRSGTTRQTIPALSPRAVQDDTIHLHGHSPRHKHSSSAQSSNVRNTSKDYPIDLINTQSTIRQLEMQIHRQNHKEASALLTDFLASVPADNKERLSAFRKLKPALVKYPRSNVPLIIQFGLEYASMGYIEMVKQEILPLVIHFASPEQLAHFELELAMLSSPGTNEPKYDQQIFEGRSSDYETPATTDGSTSSVTCEDLQLPGTEPRITHYPESSLPSEDLSKVFEEEGEEYLEMWSAWNSSDHASIQSAGVLKKMVMDGRYDQAYVLLKEINDLGIPIPLSLEYEKPAIAVLKNVKLGLKEKLEYFSAWFSLVPPYHLVQADVEFEEIRRLLLQTHLIHVALLIRFSLISAEKGYASRLSILLLPHVLRCTSPSVGRTFLDDYCKAVEGYISDPRNGIQNVIYTIKRARTNIRGQAIRSLAFSGRLDEAIALLPNPKNPTFKLTTYTYNIILQRLHALPKTVRQQNIDLVKQLRGSVDSAVHTPQTDLEDAWETELVRSDLRILETAKPVDFGEDLVAALRYLKSHIVTDKRSDTAHPFTIVNFMSLYLATGRTRALEMLLEKCLRKSFFATSNLVFAEMLFYRRLQQPLLVIKTFVDHFWLSGLPREEVLSRYFRFTNMIRSYDPSSGDDPPLQRFGNFDHTRALPRGKMWPRRVHCNLVWDALVELTTQDSHLESLYMKLNDFAEQGADMPESSVVAEADEVPISGIWRTPVGAAAFTPFMTRMMFYRGPPFGVRILRDMLRLGVRPTSYHYTELSGFYARRGDVTRVFLILDGMERGILRDLSLLQHNTGSDPIYEYCLPPPTLVTYISILRGFLIAKNLEGAEAVCERLLKVYEYIPGSSKLADLAIQDLEDFKAAGNNWVSCC